MRINGSPAVGDRHFYRTYRKCSGHGLKILKCVSVNCSRSIPDGYELISIYDQGYESAVANQGFILNLIISVITVVAILLFFIGFKNGLLIGSGLVFSIFATLIVMMACDIALQRMSCLLQLSLLWECWLTTPLSCPILLSD